MSRVEVTEERPPDWRAYGTVSIAFESATVLDVAARETGGFALRERPLDVPLARDYDAFAGEGPARWAKRFDVSRWGVLVARADGRRAGGAVLVADTPGVDMLEGRTELAVLWDLRVAPGRRGAGVGTRLFHAAEAWARERGKAALKIETQNIHPAACRFYAAMGCELRAAIPDAYEGLPGEVKLLWYKPLG